MSRPPFTIDADELLASPVEHLYASSTGGERGYKRFFIVTDPKSGTISYAVDTKAGGRRSFADAIEACAVFNEA